MDSLKTVQNHIACNSVPLFVEVPFITEIKLVTAFVSQQFHFVTARPTYVVQSEADCCQLFDSHYIVNSPLLINTVILLEGLTTLYAQTKIWIFNVCSQGSIAVKFTPAGASGKTHTHGQGKLDILELGWKSRWELSN